MDRERARDYINAQEPTFLQRAKKSGYICPVCNQGATKGQGITHPTGENVTKGAGRGLLWHCVECGKERSTLGLYALRFGIPDDREHYPEILESAAAYYGIKLDGSPAPRSTLQRNSREQYTHTDTHTHNKEPQDFSAFYREAAAHLQETDYPQRRGLSQEICSRYQIGYVSAWKHPKAPNAPSSPRLIIPISAGSYLARDTRQEIPEEQEAYKKSKVKGAEGASWTFNRQALQTAAQPVYIVEGELDALSIIDAGGEAVAIGSTAYTGRFLQELQESRPAQPLIIALDNDKAGSAAAEQLEAGLEAQGIPFYRHNPAGAYKDANERLQADRAGLQAAVEQGAAMAQERIEEQEQERREEYYSRNNAAAHLQAFVDGIKESANTPAIPTGFKKLDAALDGGLYEGLYTVGAISSLGKTTFCLQIADQIAQYGHDVLIFSLEMARNELISKSISRHTLQRVLATGGSTSNAKTARGITAGERWKNYRPEEVALIQDAIADYGRYAHSIYILEGIGDIGAQQIRETVQEHISVTGSSPVILVDYLQILAPYNDRATDKQNTDAAVKALKHISRDYKTPVIAISSLNRMNYNNPINMEAFKESGAIEYSSDVLIGLQLEGAGKPGFDAQAEKRKDPREIELVILKNRGGKLADNIRYEYYPMFNLFKET